MGYWTPSAAVVVGTLPFLATPQLETRRRGLSPLLSRDTTRTETTSPTDRRDSDGGPLLGSI